MSCEFKFFGENTSDDAIVFKVKDVLATPRRPLSIDDLGRVPDFIDTPIAYYESSCSEEVTAWRIAQIALPRNQSKIEIDRLCDGFDEQQPAALLLFIDQSEKVIGAFFSSDAKNIFTKIDLPPSTIRMLVVWRRGTDVSKRLVLDLGLENSLEEIESFNLQYCYSLKDSANLYSRSDDLEFAAGAENLSETTGYLENNDYLDDVLALEKQKKFSQAIQHLDSHGLEGINTLRLRIRLLHQSKNYKRIFELYNELSSVQQSESRFLFPYVEALANTGQSTKIARLLTELVLKDGREPVPVLTLLRAFPFCGIVAPVIREVLREAIVSRMNGKTLPLDKLLQFSHLCLSDKCWGAFYRGRDACVAGCRSEVDHAQVDFLEAQLAFEAKDFELQVVIFNRVLQKFGLSPIERRDKNSAISVFNIISSEPSSSMTLGLPLISVIMTSFNRGAAVRFAAESILEQTWRNLELIIVDDASSDDTREYLTQLSKNDSRVRPIFLEINGGTYIAKNTGLLEAKGEFVTFQDSDDWAHPDKIRVGAEYLNENSSVIATTVQHVRFNDVDGIKPRFGYLKLDSSSLMYRREVVTSRIGYFDSVRVGADSEMLRRLHLVFGTSAVVHLPHFMSFVNWDTKSLTGNEAYALDNDMGFMSPVRRNYQRGFQKWHESDESRFIPFPMETRTFHFEAC